MILMVATSYLVHSMVDLDAHEKLASLHSHFGPSTERKPRDNRQEPVKFTREKSPKAWRYQKFLKQPQNK